MAVNKNIVVPANGTSSKTENGPVLILTPCHNSHEFIDRRIVVPKNEDNAIKIGRAVGRVLAAPNNAIFDCKVRVAFDNIIITYLIVSRSFLEIMQWYGSKMILPFISKIPRVVMELL